MKRNTTKPESKIGPGTIAVIRRTHGMAAKIARIAGVHRTYVAHVLRGDKPPSEKLHIAISRAMLESMRDFDRAILEHEHPGISAR